MATIHEARLLKRISIDNGEIFYTIQVEIHAGNGSCESIDFLTKHLNTLPRLSLGTEIVKTLYEHTSTATSWVVDTFVGLWLQYLSHQGNDSTVGIEFLSCIAGIVGKLSHQVFICLSHLIGRT